MELMTKSSENVTADATKIAKCTKLGKKHDENFHHVLGGQRIRRMKDAESDKTHSVRKTNPCFA